MRIPRCLDSEQDLFASPVIKDPLNNEGVVHRFRYKLPDEFPELRDSPENMRFRPHP